MSSNLTSSATGILYTPFLFLTLVKFASGKYSLVVRFLNSTVPLLLILVMHCIAQSAPAALSAMLQMEDPSAALLLARARQNQFSGDFSAAVVCVRASYLDGIDTLRGILEIHPGSGEKRLTLRGSNASFEWWSRLGGREQWQREGLQGRPRRIPPHSLKKPAFAPDISFEDLARLPFGHLEGNRSVHRTEAITNVADSGDRAKMKDVLDRLTFVPGAGLAVLYGSLQAAFARDPVVLRRLVFEGAGGRPSKRMEILHYSLEAGGLFPTEILFAGEEGLSSVRLSLTRLQDDPARDKMDIPGAAPRASLRTFAEPEWLPRDVPESVER